MEERPDQIDKMVYSATHMIRKMYVEACRNLGQEPRKLTPVTIMQRSIR